MNIIAHPGAIVKVYVAKNPKIRQSVASAARQSRHAEREAVARRNNLLRWQDHKLRADKIGTKLMEIPDLRERGGKIRVCSNDIEYERCAECGHIQIKRAWLCRDRLCPICNWRLSIKRYAAMWRIIDYIRAAYPSYHYNLITLTVANCKPSELADTLSRMAKAWTACTYQKWARRELNGWAKAIEVTHNPATNTLHPHLHMILISADNTTPARLVAEWIKRAGREGLTASSIAQNAQIIDARPGEERNSLAQSICEAYKYTIKSDDLMGMDAATLAAYARGVAGKRLISFGGLIKDVAALLDEHGLDDAPNEDTEDDGVRLCTRCNSAALDNAIARWSAASNAYISLSPIKQLNGKLQEIFGA